ncbi:MAG: transcription elongation factor GreB [Cognaticolwellia sp.]|jgi:transcription elongation factor GreB
MVATYITPAGFQALVDEYERMLKVERPIMTREVAYAASLGDRSENAEYKYGKQRLREIDKRLHFLQKRLQSVEVVDPREIAGPMIRFGATVRYEDDATGEEKQVQIVGTDEIDTINGRVSFQSPIAKALLGKSVDDSATIQTPQGPRTVVITEITWE